MGEPAPAGEIPGTDVVAGLQRHRRRNHSGRCRSERGFDVVSIGGGGAISFLAGKLEAEGVPPWSAWIHIDVKRLGRIHIELSRQFADRFGHKGESIIALENRLQSCGWGTTGIPHTHRNRAGALWAIQTDGVARILDDEHRGRAVRLVRERDRGHDTRRSWFAGGKNGELLDRTFETRPDEPELVGEREIVSAAFFQRHEPGITQPHLVSVKVSIRANRESELTIDLRSMRQPRPGLRRDPKTAKLPFVRLHPHDQPLVASNRQVEVTRRRDRWKHGVDRLNPQPLRLSL